VRRALSGALLVWLRSQGESQALQARAPEWQVWLLEQSSASARQQESAAWRAWVREWALRVREQQAWRHLMQEQQAWRERRPVSFPVRPSW